MKQRILFLLLLFFTEDIIDNVSSKSVHVQVHPLQCNDTPMSHNRNNLLSKLAGTTWGAQASTLCTSALALCYSVAEYCCPVWSRSSHVGLVDSKLNNTMRVISGCVRPTQTPWLPVLANIAPPALRRRSATDKLLCNIEAHPNWPLYADVFNHPQERLVARRPIWADTTPVDQRAQWEEDWLLAAVVNIKIVILYVIVCVCVCVYVTLLSKSLASTCRAIPGHRWTVSC